MNAGIAPTGQIEPQPWLTAPETLAVLDALEADGTTVRFVGGCVRDAILKRPVNDMDIATPDPPERVITLLETAGIKAIPTGIQHGTVTALSGGRHYEITTLRQDAETNGRHARVVFTDDWSLDAARRDFTINTLSCDRQGRVFDYFNGMEDLSLGRVRFVGYAAERIEEDSLRILRFFRFYGQVGRPPVDMQALAACRKLAENLTKLSGERIRDELGKILMGPRPVEILTLMREQHILQIIWPEATLSGRLRALVWLCTTAIRVDGVGPDRLRRMAAVSNVDGDGAGEIARRFRLSNAETARWQAIACPAVDIRWDMPAETLQTALYDHGPETLRDLALLAWAEDLALHAKLPREQTDHWIALLETIGAWSHPDLPVRGQDILDAGLAPGPGVGSVLRAVETWWRDGGFEADRDSCLNQINLLISQRK